MKIVGLILIVLSQAGCAPVLIASAFYDHSKNRDARATFVEEYNRQNLEREKASLAPLKWCEELYRFDKNWYVTDKTCAG